jgi:hypothetical protein
MPFVRRNGCDSVLEYGDLVVVCQSEGEQDYCFLGGWSILGLLRGLREWFQSLRVVG